MTVLGTMGDGSLVLLPYLIWALAALALGLEIRARRLPTGWMSLVLVLPLALLISGRIASEWDEFSHWLHAFRYLDAFATLPGKGRPAIESCCAAYPYGWPLLGWLSSRLIGFSEAVPGLLNLFQLALCAELLARILAAGDKPGWGHHAWGRCWSPPWAPLSCPSWCSPPMPTCRPRPWCWPGCGWAGDWLSSRAGGWPWPWACAAPPW